MITRVNLQRTLVALQQSRTLEKRPLTLSQRAISVTLKTRRSCQPRSKIVVSHRRLRLHSNEIHSKTWTSKNKLVRINKRWMRSNAEVQTIQLHSNSISSNNSSRRLTKTISNSQIICLNTANLQGLSCLGHSTFSLKLSTDCPTNQRLNQS